MWNVLPKFALIKVAGLLFTILLITPVLLLTPSSYLDISHIQSIDFATALKLSTPITILFVLVVFILGKYIWRVFWHLPILGKALNKYICPDLNGVWVGQIESNREEDGIRVIKDVTVKIIADFFGFKIILLSDDGYQNSTVVQSELYKDPRTDDFYISYIFQGEVPRPLETDDRLFEGAAQLKFNLESGRLSGIYWTNRAWQRKQNTAGLIDLHRKD